MKEKVALLSVLANLVLATVKIAAGILSNSASVLAEGIHSSIDILSSGISLIGIKKAKKPADRGHPYGHFKFEVLAGLFITAILFVTGIGIIYQAGRRFAQSSPLGFTNLALGTMLFSAIVNAIMARMKTQCGKKENSVSLLSDGVHSKIDVYTSVAVLIGLALTRFWVRADSLLALAIGLFIVKESLSLGKESTDSLLDASAGEEVEKKIREIIRKENVAFSDLKTQKKGSALTANLKIEFPPTMKIDQATAAADKLKIELINGIPRLEYVAIQIESHALATASFQPVERITGRRYGGGFGWQRRSAHEGTMLEANGSGFGAYCLCEKCGYRVRREKGTPCSTRKCPDCGTLMRRER